MPFGDDFETGEEQAGGPRPAAVREVFPWGEKPSPAGMAMGCGSQPSHEWGKKLGVLPVTSLGRGTSPGLAPRGTMGSPSSLVCNLHSKD